MMSTTEALEIIDGRKCANTKTQYRRKFLHFEKWVKDNYPTCIDEITSTVNLVSIEKCHLMEFFGYICKKKDKNGAFLHPTIYQTFQHVSGYKSAIKDYFSNGNVSVAADIEKMLKEFFAGYQRKIALLKQDGVMSIVEGKLPLSFRGYKFLSCKAMEQTTDYSASIFSNFFLIMCWNLIARCVSVGSLMYNHITWENDSMVVVFPSHKGDKEGKRSSPKHVYANVAEPSICPILNFAIYIFTKGYDREGAKTTIFAGDSESRFSKWLLKLCQSNNDLLRSQGIDISMIGTHSFRKGIATFLSGTPGGPTAIAIYLRAGWSLGPVQSRYILEGEGGDQVCGRAATGLPLTDISFANLPAHFTAMDTGISPTEWEDILPGYSSFYPLNFREVIPYLLASLVHHRTFLDDLRIRHPRHPLFLQRVWTTGILYRLKDMVTTGCNRNPVSKMFATGVPPHLVLANRIVELENRVDCLDVNVRQEINVGNIDIKNVLRGLPEAIKENMLLNFRIDGVIPITQHQIADMMESMKSQILSAIRQDRVDASVPQVAAQDTDTARSNGTGGGYATWSWKSRIHPIPENFIFPR